MRIIPAAPSKHSMRKDFITSYQPPKMKGTNVTLVCFVFMFFLGSEICYENSDFLKDFSSIMNLISSLCCFWTHRNTMVMKYVCK